MHSLFTRLHTYVTACSEHSRHKEWIHYLHAYMPACSEHKECIQYLHDYMPICFEHSNHREYIQYLHDYVPTCLNALNTAVTMNGSTWLHIRNENADMRMNLNVQ